MCTLVHNAHVPVGNPRKQLPSHVAMAWPTLSAIKRAGGSASNAEIMDAVAADLKLTEEQRGLLCGRGSRTLLDYRLAWARTFLKGMGAITNDAPCQWSITDSGRKTTSEDVRRHAKAMLNRLVEYDRNRRASDAPVRQL
jgi:restriction system protein